MKNYYDLVERYHSSHNGEYIYFGAEEQGFKGLGFELEIDCDTEKVDKRQFRNACAEILSLDENRLHYLLERDNSLKCGFEIITQPHTVEAMDEFIDDAFSGILAELRGAGATDEASAAGLHIHVSKAMFGDTVEEQAESVAKLLYFIAQYPDDFQRAGRRQSMRKCKVVTEFTTETARKYAYDIFTEGKSEVMHLHRDVALNIKNGDTVEFRAMQTTLNTQTLKAEIAFTLHLVERSKVIPWEKVDDITTWLDDISWNAYEYLQRVGAFITLP